MNPRVLKRFIILMALLTLGVVVYQTLIVPSLKRPPGDYNTERGDQLLTAGDFEAAMDNFNLALEDSPDHRGALMGRALVFYNTERYDEALSEFDYLIDVLTKNYDPEDKTGVGALAAAYANRGIVHDRTGEYQLALDDYIKALKVDEESVEGPGVINKILYGSDRISTVRDRAVYLHEQLQLPEAERVLRIPELDELQRMHKP